MVNIDTVYQRVLALANKEQRGYITPQELSLYANQAQMEIFEQYFYDLNQFQRVPGNDTVYSDVDDIVEEKIQIFEDSDNIVSIASYPQAGQNPYILELPDYIYRIEAVYYGDSNCEILNTKDFKAALNGPYLVNPTIARPIANIRSGIIRVSAGYEVIENFNGLIGPTEIIYIRKPKKVEWGYFVLAGNSAKALYNNATSQNFELHGSEETELVYKILKYAGVSIKHPDLSQAGQVGEQTQMQQEKQ